MPAIQTLPQLSLGSNVYSVPIKRAVADAILARLLPDASDLGDGRSLANELARDPAAIFWFLCRLFPAGRLPERFTCQRLAEMLTPNRLYDLLIWEKSGVRVLDEERLTGLTRLVSSAVNSMDQAESGDVTTDPAALAHLLDMAPRLLQLLQSDRCQRVQEVPTWYRQVATEVDQLDSRIADLPRPVDTSAYLIEESPAALFPKLVGRLRQLAILEQEFDRQLEREKLAAMRQLAYGASHEINNPLANIATRAQTLLTDETEPVRRRMLSTISSQAFRAHEMISDMMLFAKPPRLTRESIDLVQVINGVLDELKSELPGRNVSFLLSTRGHPRKSHIDGTHMAVALKSICRNAIEAMQGDGRIDISIDFSLAAAASIYLRDTGPGITSEIRRHVFDPFFSGRDAGRGLGFGLCKAWRIINDHGGSVEVENHEDGGALFVVRLPHQAGDD